MKFFKPSNKEKVLFLDNHEFHISIDTVNYARENGVILLTFLLHCSHRLQLLYGPFKIYFCSGQNDWMTSNAGKFISIYNFPSLKLQAFNKAFTRDYTLFGFKKCSISLFNRILLVSLAFSLLMQQIALHHILH